MSVWCIFLICCRLHKWTVIFHVFLLCCTWDVSFFKNEAPLDCINLLQKAGVPQEHPMYLHCFNGSFRWLRLGYPPFPFVHFGLSPKALSPMGSHPDLHHIDIIILTIGHCRVADSCWNRCTFAMDRGCKSCYSIPHQCHVQVDRLAPG